MTNTPWWQTTTVYQIYPRSYADSNGDGIGDLQGIISKLDYIQDLGFETIWFSPFYASPQEDFGYDVSDYLSIAPEYGTIDDALQLIKEIHARGMRVLFDMVMNHTSDQHIWFEESRSSQATEKADWYIWRDGKGVNRKPNNWRAMPGGSGWHYVEERGQYYYASFLPFQPDLNYRNPDVKEAIFDCVKFWLDHGVDGFRLDIFHSIFKDEQFRNNPFSTKLLSVEENSGFFQRWENTVNLPETAEFAKELRAFVDEVKGEGMLIGEVFGPESQVKGYLGKGDGLNLIFQWDMLPMKPEIDFIRQVVEHYEESYGDPFLPVYVYGNHDQRRYLSKLKDDRDAAKLMAVLQLTARGIPVVYYGEEIGMLDGDLPTKQALDPMGQRYKWIPKWLAKLMGQSLNRDGCRTPMQWEGVRNAGFTADDATPWLPINPDYAKVNVHAQMRKTDSLYNVYRNLLHLRKEFPPLHLGSMFILQRPEAPDTLIYMRQQGTNSILIAINFGDNEQDFRITGGFDVELFSVGRTSFSSTTVSMGPKSALILGA